MLWMLAAVSLIAKWESFSPNVYNDLGDGSARIGFGMEAQGRTTITHGEAFDELSIYVFDLGNRIVKACVRHGGKSCTNPNHLAALTSLAYNVGMGTLLRSTLWRYHLGGQWEEAANQFVRYVKAGGKTYKGLVKRRVSEAIIYSGGADMFDLGSPVPRKFVEQGGEAFICVE